MPSISFKDIALSINAIELPDRCRSAVLTYEVEAQEVTAMGGNRSFIGGIQNNTVEVTLLQDFAAGETEATVYPLVGTTTTVVLKPVNAAQSATNPTYTLTGAYLASHTPINAGEPGAVGEVTLTFTGGTLTKTP